MLKPVRTAAPAVTPVSLAEAKAHCRVDHGDDDALITALIASATGYLDGWSGILGRALVNQTWAQKFPTFPAGAVIGLVLTPVSSIASITYYDADNNPQTLDTSVYTLLEDELGPFVTLQVDEIWPSTYAREDAVTVTYVAGYGAAGSDVPAPIRQAMLLMIGHWHENREAVVTGQAPAELPMAVKYLLAPYRRVGV